MSTATLENIAQQRKELVEQAAKTGKVDQAKFAELERQRKEIEANREFMAEVDRELDRVEREARQQRLDNHLTEQVRLMDAAADDCATAAAEANAAIQEAQAAIQRWRDSGMALHVAAGAVGHAGQQAGRVPPQKSPGPLDIHLSLSLGTGENARRLHRIDAPYTAPIPR